MKIFLMVLVIPFIFACAMIKNYYNTDTPLYVDVYYVHTYESGITKDDLSFCGSLYDSKNLLLNRADGMVYDMILGTCKENNIVPVKDLNGRVYIVSFDIPWTKNGCKDGSYAMQSFQGSAVKFGDNNTFIMAFDNRMSEENFQNMISNMKNELKSCGK